MKKKLRGALVMFLAFALAAPLVLTGLGSAEGDQALPVSHMIDVPWHQQFNGLFCGAASLEIVYDYWGPDIDQKVVSNVARTSSSGTWTSDIVRAGHFSYMSAAQGYFFPELVPLAGYEERPLGYAAFGYSSETFWLDEVKALIAADIPLIVLMNYYPEGGGGHYRVVVGYDDIKGVVYFSDPWGRDLNHLTDWTGIIEWTYEDFQMGWNYAEYGSPNPYFGAALIPWEINVDISGELIVGSTATVTATVTYPCPAPFDGSQVPAKDAMVEILLPEGLSLKKGDAAISIGTLNAGETDSVSWKVIVNAPVDGESLSVKAWGIVSGSVPEAWWAGNHNYYPPYDYTDAIGNVVAVNL
ncbi:MAG: C39 family peptidase [Thermoplasmata archaeon]|nr:C39 family peptidase [Thermoplasmata archaeon]